jgi:hypothetical protein
VSRKKRRRLIPFETQHQPLLPPRAFLKRVALSFTLASGIMGLSLLGGMLGYRYYEKMGWIDSFANAAMILSSMGPLKAPESDAGKIFAGLYALYSGLVFVVASGILLAPLVHRILHCFHLHLEEEEHPEEPRHQHQPG